MASRRVKPPAKPSEGAEAVAWIEKHLRVPEGKDVGKPVRLRPFQRDILHGIYDEPTRRAIITFGRKNAKTTLSAFLVLLHLCGPKAKPNSHLYSAAQSREQASILFGLAAKIVRMSPLLSRFVRIRDTAKELLCEDLGTTYRALSAEASTAYGLSPVLIIHDELGQVKGPRSELYEALETATAAQEAPLSIVISTQAPTDADLLSVLIDDAKTGGDPFVRLFMHSADLDADPFAEATIRQANPAFGDFQNAREVLAMAEDARRMPSREAEYRNLILNQRVEINNPFISRGAWLDCTGDPVTDLRGLPVYAGLDLSDCNDLTALVLVGFKDGHWHVKPTFWLPGEGLRERSHHDRVPYDLWHKGGYITTTLGKTVEYEHVAEYLRGLFDTLDIRSLAFDRWNFKHLRPWLVKAGFGEAELEARFIEFGQGFQSMNAALRETEAAILAKRIEHGDHPVLTMCMANAVVVGDINNNRKLAKAKSRGRIDGAVALAMAMSAASTFEETAVDVDAMVA